MIVLANNWKLASVSGGKILKVSTTELAILKINLERQWNKYVQKKIKHGFQENKKKLRKLKTGIAEY